MNNKLFSPALLKFCATNHHLFINCWDFCFIQFFGVFAIFFYIGPSGSLDLSYHWLISNYCSGWITNYFSHETWIIFEFLSMPHNLPGQLWLMLACQKLSVFALFTLYVLWNAYSSQVIILSKLPAFSAISVIWRHCSNVSLNCNGYPVHMIPYKDGIHHYEQDYR